MDKDFIPTAGRAKRDDPIYEYMLRNALMPYIKAARDWWENAEKKTFPYSTCYPIKDGPPGFFEKCCRSPSQSAVFGVQAFPCVLVSALKFDGPVTGGYIQMVQKYVKEGMKIEEFTLILKRGLHSTMAAASFICIVPTWLVDSISIARWVYLKPQEILELVNGVVTEDLIERLKPYAGEYRGEVKNAVAWRETKKYGEEVIRREHEPFG